MNGRKLDDGAAVAGEDCDQVAPPLQPQSAAVLADMAGCPRQTRNGKWNWRSASAA
jgi:hypothetical protein